MKKARQARGYYYQKAGEEEQKPHYRDRQGEIIDVLNRMGVEAAEQGDQEQFDAIHERITRLEGH